MTLCYCLHQFRAFQTIITCQNLPFIVFAKFLDTITAWRTQDLKSKKGNEVLLENSRLKKTIQKMAHKHKKPTSEFENM